MKNVLKMVLTYFLILIIGSFVGVIIINQLFTTTSLIAGQVQPFFATRLLARSFFVFAPVLLIYCGSLLSLYAVRHQAHKVSTAITYALLCAATWLVVFPAFLMFRNSASEVSAESISTVSEKPLSPGYLRKSGNFIYYAVTEGESVVIYTNGSDPASMMSQAHDVSPSLKARSVPFSDILIRDTMQYNLLPKIFSAYGYLIGAAESALNSGAIAWLCFASLGLALSSVYVFVGFSHWRMINTLSVMFFNILITICNFLYYTDAAEKIRGMSASLGGIFRHVENPLLVIVNCGVAIIFIVTGIAVSIVRSVRKRT